MDNQLKTPILFVIFNRPNTTRQVFEKIKAARPMKLYVAADGPRKEKEVEICEETRKIIDEVDWPCEVKTLFRQQNLGLRKNVSGAITWFFDNEEAGIILEDDCLPDKSFFSFCTELLIRYKDNSQIMHIGGNNHQDGKVRTDDSYYFSRISHIWGWATWKRAWKHYDAELKRLPEFLDTNKIADIFPSKSSQLRWIELLLKNNKSTSRSWAFRWTFSIFAEDGICITPNKNLVTNIGFGLNSTHAVDKNDRLANIEAESIQTIKHPKNIQIHLEADEYTNNTVFKKPSVPKLAKKAILKLMQVFND